MSLRSWIRNQTKKKSRIYIMPTRMGGYLNGLIFLMFLLSVGYNNNLLLIFTLFLFGFNLLWVIQTHFHLHALKLDSLMIDEGHAGESVQVSLRWRKMPEGPHKWDLSIENREQIFKIKTVHNDETQTLGQMIFPKRGLWKFQHLAITSEMPFGLYQVWIYYPIETKVCVYPSRLPDVPELQKSMGFLEGDHGSQVIGPHDVRNLAPYQGEESRKISWKHYAKSGELVIKEGEELTKTEVHFKVPESPQDKEFVLSKIATQMVFCSRNETVFSLETPSKKLRPGVNTSHLAECLRELAVC